MTDLNNTPFGDSGSKKNWSILIHKLALVNAVMKVQQERRLSKLSKESGNKPFGPTSIQAVINSSETPAQILHTLTTIPNYLDERTGSKEDHIAKSIKAIEPASFKSFCTSYEATSLKYSNYLKDGGERIETMAEEMAYDFNSDGDGTDISPKDIVDFIEVHPNGIWEYNPAQQNASSRQLVTKFKVLTGLEPTGNVFLAFANQMLQKYRLSDDTLLNKEGQDYKSLQTEYENAIRRWEIVPET
jgi:hypothetical protein